MAKWSLGGGARPSRWAWPSAEAGSAVWGLNPLSVAANAGKSNICRPPSACVQLADVCPCATGSDLSHQLDLHTPHGPSGLASAERTGV